jgi:nucleotide-binding universal stress UspA family protein
MKGEVKTMFHNILVAYDGSPTSRTALKQAYELAAAEHADVTVVTVAPSVAPLAALAPASVDGLRAELDEWAKTQLKEAKAQAPAELTVRIVEHTGHVGDEIVGEIESGHYDLVVLGSRGHGRLTTEILGSVNNHVHYHSDVPTLTIDRPEAAKADEPTEKEAAEVRQHTPVT